MSPAALSMDISAHCFTHCEENMRSILATMLREVRLDNRHCEERTSHYHKRMNDSQIPIAKSYPKAEREEKDDRASAT